MSKPWPPPPDMDSVQELVANADIEGFIAEGSPADEYETEAELLFHRVEHFSTEELTSTKLLPILEDIWQRSFDLHEPGIAMRRPKLTELAAQIERFFGPEAKPQVRGS